MISKNNVEEIKCSECPRIFKRRIKGSVGSRLSRGIKKARTKTCSKECSGIRWRKRKKTNSIVQNEKKRRL